jgi:restriction endonuclease S subunit
VAIARPDAATIDPDYLYAFLKSAPGQFQLRSRERGDWRRKKVGFRLTELNLRDLQDVPVPLPTREEQGRVVKYLESLQARTDRMKLLQTQTAAELVALFPAILHRAFKES